MGRIERSGAAATGVAVRAIPRLHTLHTTIPAFNTENSIHLVYFIRDTFVRVMSIYLVWDIVEISEKM